MKPLFITAALVFVIESMVLWQSNGQLRLSEGTICTIMALHGLSTLGTVLAIGSCVAIYRCIFQRPCCTAGRGQLLRNIFSKIFCGLVTLAILALGVLYGLSWLFFCKVGHFLDWETLEFGLMNYDMLGLHLWQSQPVTTALFCAILGGAGIVTCKCLMLKKRRSSEAGDGLPTQQAVVVFIVLLNVFFAGSEIANAVPRIGIVSSMEARFSSETPLSIVAANRTNPTMTLVVDLFRPVVMARSMPFLGPELLGASRSLPSIVNEPWQGDLPKRPVIVLAIESLRSDVIGKEEAGELIMPFVSGLAMEGLHFTNAYAQSTHSNYADPCVFSSLYPLRSATHHYYQLTDPWPKTMLYDVLHEYMYSTAMFSSQNERWGRMEDFLHTPGLDVFFDSRSFDGETYTSKIDVGFANFVHKTKSAGKLVDSVTVDHALKWLDQQTVSARPYCLSMNLQSSHFPYELPKGCDRPYRPCEIDFDASFLGYPEDKVPVIRNAYWNSLRFIDEQIERLVTAARDVPDDQRPIVVVLGDNGESFYEHGFPTHGGPPLEPQVNVALVAHCPEVLEAREVNYLTQMIDVVPTVLGLLKVSTPRSAQGVDVLAATRMPNNRRVAFFHCRNGRTKCDAVLSSSGWKYTIHSETQESFLHQVKGRNSESENFSAAYPEVERILRSLLLRWRRSQLAYHGNVANYGGFYAPPSASLSEAESRILKDAAGAAITETGDLQPSSLTGLSE